VKAEELKHLKELALDIRANSVFTSWSCKNVEELKRCFMPLAFGLPTKKKFTFFYCKRGGKNEWNRNVNEKPVFYSVSCLTKKKEEKLKEILVALDKKDHEILNSIKK